MRPLTLTIKGLRSYLEPQHIDFTDISLMAIIGPTGAGKSSILEGICFALYGRPTWTGQSAKPLIADGGDGTVSAVLTFRAKGKTWQVTRTASKKRPSNHELRCLDDDSFEPLDSSAEVKAKIEHLVGLNHEAFLKAVILPQGRFQALLHADESERPGILEAVLGLEQITEVRKQAAAKRAQLDPHKQQLELERARLTPDPDGTIDSTTRVLVEIDGRITELTSAKKIHTDAKNAHTEATQGAEALRAAANELEERMPNDAAPRYRHLRDLQGTLIRELSAAGASLRGVTAEEDRVVAILKLANDDGTGVTSTTRLLTDLRSLERQLPDLEAEERDLANQAAGITAEQADLDHRREAHAHLLERAEQAQTHASSAESEVNAASQALDEYRSHLREVRRTARDAATATDHENTARTAVEQASAAVVEAKDAVEQASEEAAAAQTALEDAHRANAAAHAAEHRGPGDPCPVCVRPLPTGFQPPYAPDITDAEHLLSVAAGRETTAAQKLVTAERKHAAAESKLTATTEASVRISFDHTAAVESLTATVGPVNLEHPDDALLAKPRLALDTAKAAKNAADRSAKDAHEDVVKDETEINTLQAALEKRKKVLTKSLAGLDRRKTAMLDTYNATPARYRTNGTLSQATIRFTIDQVEGRKNELDQLTQERETLREQAKQRQETLDATRTRMGTEVDKPAEGIVRGITLLADRAATTTQLIDSVPIPPRPEPTSLATDEQWTNQIVTAAEAIARNCRAEATIRDQAALQAQAAMTAALDNTQVSSEEDLDEQLEDARARRRVAISEQDRARADKPRVDEIDRRMELLTPQLAVLDELHSLLSDGKFKTAVSKRRQRRLLGRATKILLDMTHERFAFHHDFSIFDCQTVQPRPAKTLSGGETFLASLALALALIELTSSGGGRIESLFLDEGFGTLDIHTLAEAMDALTQQADAGRLVAVITHMQDVAENFDNILVVDNADGGSHAHWATAQEREQMITNELTGGGLLQ
ncbi:AAA family ATPase [Nocardia gipuzkoensis]